MKVVLINDQLNAGGAEKVLVYIANLLYKNSIDVSVVLLLGEAALDKQLHPNIPVHYLHRTSRFSFKAFRKLKEIVQNVDIVHVHSRYNLRYYMTAKFLVGISKPKIFFHEHVPSYAIDKFTKFLFSKVNAYVAVQDDMRKWAVEKGMVKNSNAFYLANTVVAPTVKKEVNSNSHKIIMVGNYRPQKNQLFAVSVLAKLPEEYTIDIYGMIDDKLYYERLQNHIQTLQLEHRVNLVKGVSNIYEKISEYGLALHTSLAETGPLVLVEYLYAQIPFITYETGDVVSVIKNQLPNFIVPTFDEQDWLNAIEKMQQINNFEETKSLMTTIINQHFSEEAYYTQLLNIYQQLV